MKTSEPLPTSVLSRKAIVYVRQSTPGQVEGNTESTRRQYDLVELARNHGFSDVEVVGEPTRLRSGFVKGYTQLPVRLTAA